MLDTLVFDSKRTTRWEVVVYMRLTGDSLVQLILAVDLFFNVFFLNIYIVDGITFCLFLSRRFAIRQVEAKHAVPRDIPKTAKGRTNRKTQAQDVSKNGVAMWGQAFVTDPNMGLQLQVPSPQTLSGPSPITGTHVSIGWATSISTNAYKCNDWSCCCLRC